MKNRKLFIMILFLLNGVSSTAFGIFDAKYIGKNKFGKNCIETGFLRRIHCEGDLVDFSESSMERDYDPVRRIDRTYLGGQQGNGIIQKFIYEPIHAVIQVQNGSFWSEIKGTGGKNREQKSFKKGDKITVNVSDISSKNKRANKDER